MCSFGGTASQCLLEDLNPSEIDPTHNVKVLSEKLNQV